MRELAAHPCQDSNLLSLRCNFFLFVIKEPATHADKCSEKGELSSSLTTTALHTCVSAQCVKRLIIIAILDAHSAARGKNIIAVRGAFSVKCGKCRQANLFLHIKTLART